MWVKKLRTNADINSSFLEVGLISDNIPDDKKESGSQDKKFALPGAFDFCLSMNCKKRKIFHIEKERILHTKNNGKDKQLSHQKTNINFEKYYYLRIRIPRDIVLFVEILDIIIIFVNKSNTIMVVVHWGKRYSCKK